MAPVEGEISSGSTAVKANQKQTKLRLAAFSGFEHASRLTGRNLELPAMFTAISVLYAAFALSAQPSCSCTQEGRCMWLQKRIGLAQFQEPCNKYTVPRH